MTPDRSRGEVLDIHAGDVLCGRYRADSVIGRGETGIVVGATDLLRGGEVAIKMLEPAAEEVDLLTARLRREAHVLAQLTSPHVVRVFDVEKHGGAVCMIMELMRGGTLAEVVRRRGPLPIDEAVGYIVQACDGIAEAHALGIVHRDLKPQNLFLAERGDGTAMVKVLDFGVSKQGGGLGLTATGAALGSPLYTAVEQLRDASRVDGRADIWSLGLVLYFLLCRRNAFDADNPVALMLRIATAPPVPLRERRPEVPEDLEAVILQCVEKDVDRRFRSVAALTRALLPFAPPWAEGFLASIEARTARRSLPSLPPVGSVPPPSVAPPSVRAPPPRPVATPVPPVPVVATPVPPVPVVATPVPPVPVVATPVPVVATPVPPVPVVATPVPPAPVAAWVTQAPMPQAPPTPGPPAVRVTGRGMDGSFRTAVFFVLTTLVVAGLVVGVLRWIMSL